MPDYVDRKWKAAIVIAIAALAGFDLANAQSGCGSPADAGGYGPFDYRKDKGKLHIVEVYHFTSEVETLRRGKTSTVGGDISYTLKAFPNHHRALMSMVNLVFKERKAQPDGAEFPIDCYFQRAEQFAPDDPWVKVIHGIYLVRDKKPKQAVEFLEQAASIAGDDPNVNYNLALALIDVGQVDEAVKRAHIAYGAGFPLPGLRNKLKALGKWTDTPDSATSSTK